MENKDLNSKILQLWLLKEWLNYIFRNHYGNFILEFLKYHFYFKYYNISIDSSSCNI